ncbi:MAG: hypothetical protein IT162_05050 [Bryobacterales bacterium]|nr:hypothetical protein [Bryobacterales bacterium]
MTAAAAVAASPHDAPRRIRYGLELEEAGRAAAAERELLAAARLSRKYEPRWTLAGFYFRQNNAPAFWQWAREAASVAYRDPEPLFDLAAAWEPARPAAVRERLGIDESLPVLWRAWVYHTARRGWLDEVEAILGRARGLDPAPVADALLAGGRIGALARWPGHRLLDWRFTGVDGVQFSGDGTRGFTVGLSGRQPDPCDLAMRLFADEPRPQDWQMNGVNTRGLSWHAARHGADGWSLTLRYARPPGEVRMAGNVQVQAVR